MEPGSHALTAPRVEGPLNLSFVTIDNTEKDVVVLRFVGAIDEADGVLLVEQLDELIALSSGTLVLSFRALSYCDLGARDHLVEMHTRFFTAGLRCAYVADRSIFRGLASYIIHAAGDDFARVFDRRQRAVEHVKKTTSTRLEVNAKRLDDALSYMRGRRGRR